VCWIHAIRTWSIAHRQPEIDDPLLQAEAALVRMEADVFYEFSFHETNKPLGVVLERSGEWAIVRLSTGQ
jgi:hypothetical protein